MAKFDYFVVFAEMRTGSNFLETNLNAFDGLQCHGEAFNPHFIGYPGVGDILGVTQRQRDAQPATLIEAIKSKSAGLGGFRYFNDHDPRVFDLAMNDPRCAKIILTRNPIESYISLRIAIATGQWKLTNVKHAKSETVEFDELGFEKHLESLQAFQVRLLNSLQKSGQTAFYVAYEDLQDLDVMNGMAEFLGCAARLGSLDKKLKKQNPEPMTDKVVNFDQMERALARLDRFNLTRTPNFEPRRGAVIPSYVAAPKSSLLYLPMRSGPEKAVLDWMAALDGCGRDGLTTGFSHKSLREWKKTRPGHRTFTVLRHPVARAHAAFCEKIVPVGPGTYGEIRNTLRKSFGLKLPEGAPGDDYGSAAHRSAFLGFLAFLKANLAGQTGVRVDPTWASQAAVLQGWADFSSPDLIVREDRLESDLAYLALTIGIAEAPIVAKQTDPYASLLRSIYDDDVENAAADAYHRDYQNYGFGSWA